MAPDIKPSEPGRKFNPGNVPTPGDDNNPKNKFRFNIYWVYAIVLATIIGFNFFRTVSGTGVDTTVQVFKQMMLQGDVDEYKVITNTKQVRVFVKADSLKKKADFYKNLLMVSKDGHTGDYDNALRTPPPQFVFNISDLTGFSNSMADFIKDHPSLANVTSDAGEEGDLIRSVIGSILPILF